MKCHTVTLKRDLAQGILRKQEREVIIYINQLQFFFDKGGRYLENDQ